MPVMDGYETTRAIRAIDRFASLPIIAITVKTTDDERQRCLDAGASDYISKPVDTIEFLAIVEPWLPTNADARHSEGAGRRTHRPSARSTPAEWARGQPDRRREDPRRRRRHPQHLRDDGAPRARSRRRDGRRKWSRSARRARADARFRHRLDGHHDADDGRVRNHPRDPKHRSVQGSGRHRRHRQGDGRRTPALPRCRSERLRSETGRRGRAHRIVAALAADRSGIRSAVAPNGAASRTVRLSRRRAERQEARSEPCEGTRRQRDRWAEDPRRRRRLPQHLRDDRAPRTEPRRCRGRRERCRRARRSGADPRHRPRPDGHHDAVMDGYDTMRAIRAIDRFASLPIVAVTGKAIPANASVASMPEPTPTSRSRWTTPSSSRRSNHGCPPPRRSPLHDAPRCVSRAKRSSRRTP